MNILKVISVLDISNLWTGLYRVVFDVSMKLASVRHDITVLTSA